MTPRLTALLLGLALVAVATPSQWQGGPPPERLAGTPAATGERWLLLDSGGSGGMFGKGDIRGNLRDVGFWKDGLHGIACGHTGAFRTVDGGLTWSRIRERPDERGGILYRCGISGPDDLWVAEGKHPAQGRHLWHSADGGATWEDAATRFPGKFESIWDLLVRGDHIWLLGGWAPEASYQSADGGKTWRRLVFPEGFEPYRATTPTDQPKDKLGTVFVLGATRDGNRRIPRLLRGDAAGESWREIALPAGLTGTWAFNHGTVAFADERHGWLGLDAAGLRRVGDNGLAADPGSSAALLVTADGGATWERRQLPPGEFYPTALCRLPDGRGYVGVWNGFDGQRGGARNGVALYRTLDDGRSWQVVFGGARQIDCLFALDNQRLWAVGDRIGFTANDVIAIRQPSP